MESKESALEKPSRGGRSTRVFLLEPFYGGSHAQLLQCLTSLERNPGDGAQWKMQCFTLPAKKWHWRTRASSLWFSEQLPLVSSEDPPTLFCSSMLNLTELLGIRPDLHKCKKIIYFHENQLEYPRRGEKLDFHFGWMQILSSLAADVVVFNSLFNMKSFLARVDEHLGQMPVKDQRPTNVADRIAVKSKVLYFPLTLPSLPSASSGPPNRGSSDKPLTIVWNHRWEYDKDPDTLLKIFVWLDKRRLPFQAYVLGECFAEVPHAFEELKAHPALVPHLKHVGYVPSKEEYFSILRQSDVVLSTAIHEFYGVSVLEAFLCGCYPVCPNRLSYPELFDDEHLYSSLRQLKTTMTKLCRAPQKVRDWKQAHLSEVAAAGGTSVPPLQGEGTTGGKSNLLKKILWDSQQSAWKSLLSSQHS